VSGSFSTAFDGGFDLYTPTIDIDWPGGEAEVVVRDPAPSPMRSQAVEDTMYRDPEWETIEAGYGQQPTMRTFLYDPVHGYFFSEGPKIVTKRPVAPP
jgi:hypothetical protein